MLKILVTWLNVKVFGNNHKEELINSNHSIFYIVDIYIINSYVEVLLK